MECWDLHLHLGRSRDGACLTVAEIRDTMNQWEIGRGVVFAIDEEACGPSYERTNDKVLKFVAQELRLIAFARLNPREKIKALAEFRRCQKSGARGVKLHPRSENFSPEEAEDLVSEIEKARLPILLHTSHELHCRPLEWEKIFKRHSKIPFVLAHGGKDAFEEAIAVAKRLPNVWIETSTLSYWRTQVVLRKVGSSRVVFGSDLPYSHPAIERLKFDLLLSPSQRKEVYLTNAQKILGE